MPVFLLSNWRDYCCMLPGDISTYSAAMQDFSCACVIRWEVPAGLRVTAIIYLKSPHGVMMSDYIQTLGE